MVAYLSSKTQPFGSLAGAERVGQLDPQSVAVQSVHVLIGDPLSIADKLPLVSSPQVVAHVLNLRRIFQDAIDVFSQYASHLKVLPLPTTVYLMQRDVINHYRHAATHYLPLTLNEHFLQRSSLGTPYEKWAKFTNDDFEELSFTITNLMRYTTRLIHETETAAQVEARCRQSNLRSNAYIGPLVEIAHKGKRVGLHVNPDKTLTRTPFPLGRAIYGSEVGMRAVANGQFEYYQITTDVDGNKHDSVITQSEFEELTQSLPSHRVELADRAVLKQLQADALTECDELSRLNDLFGALTNSYSLQQNVAAPFDRMNEGWWLP